ncbi:MAG: hypothetical protein Q9222_006702 [Ikaeria aurantiellina]
MYIPASTPFLDLESRDSVGYIPKIPSDGTLPFASPPPGVTANRDHPVSNAFRGYIAAGVCLPLIFIFASIRAYAKLRIQRSRTKDDFTFMLATVWTVIYIGLIIAMLKENLFGMHAWDLTLNDLHQDPPVILILILECLYGPFIWLIKLSLFLLYLEIFSPLRYLRILVWVGVAVTALFYFPASIAKIALCAPRGRETYAQAYAASRCGDSKAINVCIGVFNIVSDLYLLVLPIRPTLKLNLPLRRRIGVLFVFTTGLSALNASIAGLVYRIRVNNQIDNTWNIVPVYLVM